MQSIFSPFCVVRHSNGVHWESLLDALLRIVLATVFCLNSFGDELMILGIEDRVVFVLEAGGVQLWVLSVGGLSNVADDLAVELMQLLVGLAVVDKRDGVLLFEGFDHLCEGLVEAPLFFIVLDFLLERLGLGLLEVALEVFLDVFEWILEENVLGLQLGSVFHMN